MNRITASLVIVFKITIFTTIIKPVLSKCTCPEVLYPVCGSDGITYRNEICRRCHNITLVRTELGVCEEEDTNQYNSKSEVNGENKSIDAEDLEKKPQENKTDSDFPDFLDYLDANE
ncbi:unnamed protein product [Arctia plantaginis]|uniref:Kazal-like domain-containing protein n=1 Tax=Arctia plantaginis TaxID=874455 RepID=A0A8S1AHV5_ARCPL|nr:unnamed protein product [Arctia plantaginis]CAB3260591.1 unnamed protein product [Arctia plantaginis]